MDPAHQEQVPHGSFFGEIIKFSLIAILVIVPVRVFIAQPYIVQGASMEPTFETGQYLIVDQLSYRFEEPQRGDVIIFRYPRDPSKFFIKRVIGLPGEMVRLQGENVIIENENHPDGFILDEPYLISENRSGITQKTRLESDEYFVMGDNRRASSDSRVWGPLGRELIAGRALLRLFPLNTTEVFPGDITLSAD